MTNKPTLKRNLSLYLVTFYGLGNILGAGIYVLVGKVAGEAGYFAPLAFLIASIIAAISAFTYAELSARYPVSAGEAVYLYEGFGFKSLSLIVGLMITLAGIVSTAVIAHGFSGYMQVFFDLPQWLMISLMLFALGGLAVWGIKESVQVAAFLTLTEITGLMLIVFVGVDELPMLTQVMQQTEANSTDIPLLGFSLLGVFSGAFLAFYAYIGFEDMVNVAEEVKDPQRTMPKAIIISVVISTLLYSIVSLVAVSVISPVDLASSKAPLADVYSEATGKTPVVITVIGIFAVINGALIQIIMAARLLYGMSSKGWLPKFFSQVSPRTRTPVNSTIVTVMIMLMLALGFEMVSLVEFTSYLVLSVFALVNLSLIKIKMRQAQVQGVKSYPMWVPVMGFITIAIFLMIELASKLL